MLAVQPDLRVKPFELFVSDAACSVLGPPLVRMKRSRRGIPDLLNTPHTVSSPPCRGVFHRVFYFYYQKIAPGKHGRLAEDVADPALQPGQGWAKPTPQGHGLDAVAGRTPSRRAWRTKTLRRQDLENDGLTTTQLCMSE